MNPELLILVGGSLTAGLLATFHASLVLTIVHVNDILVTMNLRNGIAQCRDFQFSSLSHSSCRLCVLRNPKTQFNHPIERRSRTSWSRASSPVPVFGKSQRTITRFGSWESRHRCRKKWFGA